MKTSEKKVWFITGCSTGFGRAFAEAALAAGYSVAVTARNEKDVADIITAYPDTSISIPLDVTNEQQIKKAIHTAIHHFGKIDVLINNAGIGYFGSVEESEEAEIRRMMEINFFGLSNLTREVLPLMRSQKSGHIINVASIGGFTTFPALGYYHATKYAVVGLSETLAKEVNQLGIKVTIVAPGGFRTDWAGRSANETKGTIADYNTTSEAIKSWLRSVDGKQAGDPVKAAEAIIKVVESENPPLHLLLGTDAMELARKKLEELSIDFNNWESTTINVNF